MPISSKTDKTPAADCVRVSIIYSYRFILLLGALVLCAVVIWANCYQPLASGAIAVSGSAQIQPESAVQPPPPSTTLATKKSDKMATTPSIWPAQGTITSGFGWRVSPMTDGSEVHQGIDIAYALGAPVVATADGQVVQSGLVGGYGNMVQIDHGNGLATIYGHNSKLAVSFGQSVKKGEIIAYAGSTGRSTGPHVHYEVRVNNTPVDPWKYLVLF